MSTESEVSLRFTGHDDGLGALLMTEQQRIDALTAGMNRFREASAGAGNLAGPFTNRFAQMSADLNKLKNESESVNDAMASMRQLMSSVGDGFLDVAIGAGATLTGFLSLSKGVQIWMEIDGEIKAALESLRKFNAEQKPFVTLPANLSDPDKSRDRSLQLGAKYGVDQKTVAETRKQISIESSDQSPEVQDKMLERSLQFHQVTGANPQSVAKFLDNTGDAFGTKVDQSANLLEYLREHGVDVNESSSILEQIAPSIAAAGGDAADAGATMTMFAQAGGKNSALSKALSGVFSQSDALVAKGLIQKPKGMGDFIDQLGNLEMRDPAKFETVLGKRAIPAVDFAVKHRAEFEKWRKEASAAMDDNAPDMLQNIEQRLLTNKDYKATMTAERADAVLSNAPVAAITDAERDKALEDKYREVGAMYAHPTSGSTLRNMYYYADKLTGMGLGKQGWDGKGETTLSKIGKVETLLQGQPDFRKAQARAAVDVIDGLVGRRNSQYDDTIFRAGNEEIASDIATADRTLRQTPGFEQQSMEQQILAIVQAAMEMIVQAHQKAADAHKNAATALHGNGDPMPTRGPATGAGGYH